MTTYLVVGVPMFGGSPQFEAFHDLDSATREFEDWLKDSVDHLQLIEITPKPAGFGGMVVNILREK